MAAANNVIASITDPGNVGGRCHQVMIYGRFEVDKALAQFMAHGLYDNSFNLQCLI